MVLDTYLFNTLYYKVYIKGKVEQAREKSSAPLHIGVVAIEMGAYWSPSTKGRQLCFYYLYLSYNIKTELLGLKCWTTVSK